MLAIFILETEYEDVDVAGCSSVIQYQVTGSSFARNHKAVWLLFEPQGKWINDRFISSLCRHIRQPCPSLYPEWSGWFVAKVSKCSLLVSDIFGLILYSDGIVAKVLRYMLNVDWWGRCQLLLKCVYGLFFNLETQFLRVKWRCSLPLFEGSFVSPLSS